MSSNPQQDEFRTLRAQIQQYRDTYQQSTSAQAARKLITALVECAWSARSTDTALTLECASEVLEFIKSKKVSLNTAGLKKEMGRALSAQILVFEREGRYVEATSIGAEAVHMLEESKDWGACVETYNNLGHSYKYLGKRDRAIESYNEALRIAEHNNLVRMSLLLRMNLAMMKIQDNLLDEVVDNLQSLEEPLSLVGTSTDIVKLKGNLARIAVLQSRYDEAEDYYQQAFSADDGTTEAEVLAAIYNNYSRLLLNRGLLEEALNYTTRALSIATNAHFVRLEIEVNNRMGMIFSAAEDYVSAIEHYLRALALQDEYSIMRDLSTPNILVGLAYYKLGHYDLALQHHTRAYEVCKVDRTEINESSALVNMASCCIALHRLDEAAEYCALARPLALASHLHVPLSHIMQCEAQIQRMRGDYSTALATLEEVVKLQTDMDFIAGLVESYLLLLALLLEVDQLDRFLPHAQKAMALSVQMRQKSAQAQIHRFRSQYYEARSQAEMSLQELKAYVELFREQLSEANSLRAKLLLIRYEVKEHQREAMLQKQKSQQLESEMKRAHEDLSNKTLQLVQQSRMMDTFRSEVETILHHASNAESAIRVVRQKLNELPKNVLNWNAFEEEFQAVHPSFQSEIKKRIPELTTMEMKICCLLRIGMNSREIASLLFLSERSVENHRYRLRKKIHLEEGQELPGFLQTI